jgi:hypothetical protein
MNESGSYPNRLIFGDILDVRKQEAHELDVAVAVSYRAKRITDRHYSLPLTNFVYLQLGQVTIKGNVIKLKV